MPLGIFKSRLPKLSMICQEPEAFIQDSCLIWEKPLVRNDPHQQFREVGGQIRTVWYSLSCPPSHKVVNVYFLNPLMMLAKNDFGFFSFAKSCLFFSILSFHLSTSFSSHSGPNRVFDP